VWPLPTLAHYTYCLTAVDRFTSWPEVVPIPDITADTVACALLTGWISCFSRPQTITTNQERQIRSQLFHSLAKLCSIQLSWTIAHQPAANGLGERFTRTLKAAIMCHADQHWREALPLVLLRIRTVFKEDLQESVAELVHGESLRIPGELLTPTADPLDPAHLITELLHYMARLRPVPAAHHASPVTLVHSDLEKCKHVFLHQDKICRALQHPYGGHYQVLSRKEKTLQLLMRGRPVTVSTPPYMLNETDCGTTTFNPAVDTTPAIAPSTTASRTNCTFRTTHTFPCSLQDLSDHLRRGGG
jgi:cleavage and polyadenylation specificity factor subunit 1